MYHHMIPTIHQFTRLAENSSLIKLGDSLLADPEIVVLDDAPPVSAKGDQ